MVLLSLQRWKNKSTHRLTQSLTCWTHSLLGPARPLEFAQRVDESREIPQQSTGPSYCTHNTPLLTYHSVHYNCYIKLNISNNNNKTNVYVISEQFVKNSLQRDILLELANFCGHPHLGQILSPKALVRSRHCMCHYIPLMLARFQQNMAFKTSQDAWSQWSAEGQQVRGVTSKHFSPGNVVTMTITSAYRKI